MLPGMIIRLNETGRYGVMEKDVTTTKILRISRQASPVRIMIDKKELERMKCFSYLCSMITSDAKCTM